MKCIIYNILKKANERINERVNERVDRIIQFYKR